MVAAVDLTEVNQLVRTVGLIDQALRGLDNKGVIVQMTISDGPLPEDRPPRDLDSLGATVPTVGMTYPQNMVDQIRTSLQQRRSTIEAQLQKMGLTGLDDLNRPEED